MNSSFDWIKKGTNYIEKDELAKALSIFNEVIKKDPENIRAWLLRSEVEFVQKRYREAFKSLKTVIKLNPEQVDAWINMGNTYRELAGVRRGEILKTNGPKSLIHFKFTPNEIELLNQSLKSFNRALKIVENHENALMGKSGVLLSLEKYRETIETFNLLIKHHPRSRHYFYALLGKANALKHINEKRKAKKILKEVKKKSPKNSDVQKMAEMALKYL
ncbi:MAG: tetratricopeptide repeat protein [Candidatus Hodarchaeales archaeon]|jgi:tetratricopeptide (TPR) repeat protein